MEDSKLLIASQKAEKWLQSNLDSDTCRQIDELLKNHLELVEAFATDLEFGTGGLRGIMGAGTNRMNIYTVQMATQGFCNYIIKSFPKLQNLKVAVSYDSRNNSKKFAEATANVFSANGFKVFIFESLRPTPELSFAVRNLKCIAGVMLTASHNPKEYNGYKAYWTDGGQLVPPHDKNVILEVNAIKSFSDVKNQKVADSITILGKDFDEVYINEVIKTLLSPASIKNEHNLKIVYTPIHGTGVELVPMTLKKIGFTNVHIVKEQATPDGNFPTVISPNPEEKAALNLALELAKKIDAELVMATDPDGDRVGVAVKNLEGEHILLNGNQTATILTYYMLSKWKENKKLKGNEYIVKTIVTTELIAAIANDFNVEYFDVLTGFKYIAEVILENEEKKKYICGGEESYGFLVGDYVRDKDAVSACAMLAECAAWAKEHGKTLYNLLIEIYCKYGFYKESLLSITKKGSDGKEEIKKMMKNFRQNPPSSIASSKIVCMKDYQLQISHDFTNGSKTTIEQPKSDVLQFITTDGSIISIRPSGTEPKIKFYFGVKEKLTSPNDFNATGLKLDLKIENIINSLNVK
ncbi:MAG: phosphoglucomutase [Bacteroidetes bacterium CG_4_10_14_3_um_filter_31_20]|nr:MAG: phosphoglucomutase [Bacteroidetes bacterium CG_4_10_14_3_um_filter_31_20]